MIKPKLFYSNETAATDNHFMHTELSLDREEIDRRVRHLSNFNS
jgi:hypothetical protein